MTQRLLPPHPFPARMAPEIALSAVANREVGTVLDPMCGSGTVLKAAEMAGREAIGFDVDPLAVLMSKVWTSHVDLEELIDEAQAVLQEARRMDVVDCRLPWIDDDPETGNFIKFWFADFQANGLRRLAYVLQQRTGPVGDALRLAMSRMIITKDRGASLARDVSHSRPHRVRTTNDYDVMREFPISVERMARRLRPTAAKLVDVRSGDSRTLQSVPDASISTVVTSPPYLHAIDYLRGHKLSLVWLGHTVAELRTIRSDSIGAARKLDPNLASPEVSMITGQILSDSTYSKLANMVQRYVLDVSIFLRELRRVLMPRGEAVIVVGNTVSKGVLVDNAQLIRIVAEAYGFHLTGQEERLLPPSRRYLPPPSINESSGLNSRMHAETILTFAT